MLRVRGSCPNPNAQSALDTRSVTMVVHCRYEKGKLLLSEFLREIVELNGPGEEMRFKGKDHLGHEQRAKRRNWGGSHATEWIQLERSGEGSLSVLPGRRLQERARGHAGGGRESE